MLTLIALKPRRGNVSKGHLPVWLAQAKKESQLEHADAEPTAAVHLLSSTCLSSNCLCFIKYWHAKKGMVPRLLNNARVEF